MDIGKLFRNVQSLNEYISTTQDATEKCKTSKILLNMSTVLALKKIRSLEIEYFNKCEENGIACTIFDRMLCLPPSKTWSVLSKELVNLLQYWLDATRKHLVRHNLQWWTFLKLLLRFVKEIRQKDASLPNILVEHTAESLLDLATNSCPDAYQRYEILHCFNMYCSESSREVRFAFRNKLGPYFTKLSSYMSNCGHLPTQYSIMETLLRWLLPRHDATLRLASATKWFHPSMYQKTDVNIFLERSWVNFFQDARDFLNAHNQRDDLITSVVCRKLTVGKVVVISGTERQDSWLDMNCVTRSVSVLLDPRALEPFGSSNHKAFETLVITHYDTCTVKLFRESETLLVSLHTTTPPQLMPSRRSLGADVSCDVTAVVTSRCHLARIDAALRRIFDDKYELLLDLNKELELSPINQIKGPENPECNNDLDQRFSHPVEVKKRKQCGYMVRSRQPVACPSPSSASTSSLAQLHEKLAALPRFKYDKEPISVCALPELSMVTEVSETEDLNSTLKYKPYGVCYYKNYNKLEVRKSQSDPETSRKTFKGRVLSPVVNEDAPSCLLVATIGSADDSVINDTVDRMSKSKDYNADNIVDLLVQEALQTKDDKYKSDSGINSADKKSLEQNDNSETIDNTPDVDKVKVSKISKKTKVVSSTSDESNTEVISETPCFVNTRKKNKIESKHTAPRNSFDELVVEQFFSQHFTENDVGEMVISPTLAKKINESSSESGDNFCENFKLIGEEEEVALPYDFNNEEVLECLNCMIDKVCDDFDKCTKYLSKDDEIALDPHDTTDENIPLKEILNTIQVIEAKKVKKETMKKSDVKKKITLKYKITPKKTSKKTRASKRNNKLELESTSKMSTIIEDNLESAPEITENKVEPEIKEREERVVTANKDSPANEALETETPILRRKRKLYSPKDEQTASDSPSAPDENTKSELIKKTPKSTATCYKEIEKYRQKNIRKPRNRKSKIPEPPSPRTKQMNDMFDKIKESADTEKVRLADKTFEIDVYNFTSDSEDEFKVKKINVSKRNSTTTIASVESTVSKRGRAVKRINYTDTKSSDESNTVKRKVNRKPRTKKKINIENIDLVDERMRKAEDVLNTSMVIEKTKNTVNEPELVLVTEPEMEVIGEKNDEKLDNAQKKKGKKPKIETSQSKRPKRVLNKAVIEKVKNFDEDRTESPLPGLLVEPVPSNKDDTNDISATMVDKFKKFYRDGPENYINESNTTQNLLSDVERINYSPPNVDVTEELLHLEKQLQNKETDVKPRVKTTKKKTSNSIILENTKKTKPTPKKTKVNEETINISEITDPKSDNTIATIGITGHGELEEAPPSTTLINERLEPRNLEVEDLDHSMRHYYEELTKVINASHNRDSSGSNEERLCKNVTKARSIDSIKSMSPAVSLKRLSPDDISKWLPSRRNSESDESYVSAKSMKHNSEEHAAKILESMKLKTGRDDNNSDTSEVNVPKRQSLRLIFQNQQADKIVDSGQTKSKHDSDSDSENEYLKPDTKKLKISTKVEPKKTPKSVNKNDKKAKPMHASLISPIKLFEDMISIADKRSETTLSDDEEYMKEIIHTLNKKDAETEPKNKILEKSAEKVVIEQKNSTKSIESLSTNSKMSTSTKIEDSRSLLKRTLEGEREDYKKRKVELNNNEEPCSSGLTVSSVEDWFKRMEPETSSAEVVNASMRHSVQGVLEKLDTTLVEINRNTSKKFVHLFVDAQKHLCELKERRRGMYRELAADILAQVVNIMDDKFAELDKRSQENDNDFMKKLKERASELIREDCKQKRAMVRLLKEDVQAVIDHLDKQGTS
nr:uncharacterized protein LOC110382481 [Helicoverpa armigera]